MQPIKINSTEAELPQELQDQSTSGEDGSQVLTFTTKEIREKKPELLSYIKVCFALIFNVQRSSCEGKIPNSRKIYFIYRELDWHQ